MRSRRRREGSLERGRGQEVEWLQVQRGLQLLAKLPLLVCQPLLMELQGRQVQML